VLPDGFDMGSLFQQAQRMQQEMEQAQTLLGAARVTGTAGGGLVKVTVTGLGELIAIEIDPKAVDPQDTETLADLIIAAVRDANHSADSLQQDKMGPLTAALGTAGLGLGPAAGTDS
jgi:nucleoid-associated protein EbfC